MRRIVSLWLPRWPTDCWHRAQMMRRPQALAHTPSSSPPNTPATPEPRPLALAASGQGGLRLVAVDRRAAAEGLSPTPAMDVFSAGLLLAASLLIGFQPGLVTRLTQDYCQDIAKNSARASTRIFCIAASASGRVAVSNGTWWNGTPKASTALRSAS